MVDAAAPPPLYSQQGLYGSLMEWAMRDECFKTQLFRFVDVLPALGSPAEVARHLKEYLGDESAKLAPSMRFGLKAATSLPRRLLSAGVKTQITGLARQFILDDNPKSIIAGLLRLREQGIAFSVDLLGEAVVSEVEADRYAARYQDLIRFLAAQAARWPAPKAGAPPEPLLNFSLKASALYSQIHPADPDTAVEKISARLRPILARAREAGAFVNFDMESYALKDLTLRVFKTLLSEPAFAGAPACGIVLQAYLRDSDQDLGDLIAWARQRGRRITIRLVKGAYWDYETAFARQRGWPEPVFTRKAETDASFENLSLRLLQSSDAMDAAFGTHNVRSIAYVLAQADKLGRDHRSFEFQMLRGMAEPIKSALLQLGCGLREYCAVGELLPGMAYLVRRLLENTSNEGFLAKQFARHAGKEELLQDPRDLLEAGMAHHATRTMKVGPSVAPAFSAPAAASPSITPLPPPAPTRFLNEPPTDFTRFSERQKLHAAIRELRGRAGSRVPLVINHKPVATHDWLPSLNPANQREVIGFAAQAGIDEAEAALAAARAAQPAWGRVPADQRARVLERLAALLRRDKAALCALEILEAGKNWTEADADVAEAIDFCNFYASVMRALGKPARTQSVPGESNLQHWWPRGVGVIIAPWNFPLAILTGMAAAAVVAGNAVILKPSDQTPLMAARLMDLCIQAEVPAGVVNLLTGPGGRVGAHLVEHPGIDFIAFTGSKEIGLRIWQAAARTPSGQANLKKVVCEMGGKNCAIVDSDADLDEAVAACLASAFGYQGQKCSALSRLVVLAENHDRFIERLIAAAASMRIGPAETPGTLIGPVISRQAQQRLNAVVTDAKREATLAWEGVVPTDPEGCYVSPAIFTGVPSNSRLWREELFGPVLAIRKARDFDEALTLANDSEFALTGGCFSRSPANIALAESGMVCGNLYINRAITGALVERQPFGGFKMSGGGTKGGGREYLQNFLVPRVVTENRLRRGFAPEETEPTISRPDL